MLSVGKPASLVQQKKEQWARERGAYGRGGARGGSRFRRWNCSLVCSDQWESAYIKLFFFIYTNRFQIRNQFASTLELHKQSSYEYQEPIQRQRSPSLPPIRNNDPEKSKEERRTNVLNRNIPSAKRFAFYDEDAEGDTSGYGSETINHMNRCQNDALHDVTNNRNPVVAWQQGKENRNISSSGGRSADGAWSARSQRSNTAEEGRPRWGDRGVATGRLWEPTAPNARLPQMQNQKKGTPSWVERGLNMIENTAEVLVIDQTSSTNSGFDCDRSSCNGSDEGKTFLRGQNVPLEPEIKAQRENKRIKALELQSAILSQLEDREKRRLEERERRLREERLEELRIQRQQEEDKLRLEEEKRKHEEKQLMEQKKLETLKKALEDAEKKARLEKEKRFISHRQHINTAVPIESKPKEEDIISTTNNSILRNESISPTKTNRTYDLHSAKSQKKDCESHQTTEFNSPRSVGPGNLNLFIHSVPPLALADNQFNIVPIGLNGNSDISGQPSSIQLAVLVPQNLTNNLYSVSVNSLNHLQELTDTGKILTPRKYRSGKTKDASTQTEINTSKPTIDKIVETQELERNIDKNYPSIDENAPQESHHNTLKKDRRFRSEERYKKEIENRPKWGVNRPAAQYKKQSEKDPFYSQKRKMRQKYRPQARQYLSQSSDDSRSPSPPLRQSEKMTEAGHKQRNSLSQSYWKNKRSSQDLSRPVHITENDQVTPEFSNLSHIINDVVDNKKSPKMSPTKRMTLSQKFINDKYGNRKLWIDDVNERNNKSNIFDVENRKKIIDQFNVTKREYLDKNEDQENLIVKTKY
ncbi:histone-lysine N-methyltransferase, H3 lysine-79 specific [Galleria mellonella]|uniref:Histone-lysine N-methyltransferase, H3 lysine-79 specific n=1 Tax=Galleria mellonella TaxID=7137 RepID=A0ABM3MUK8_GALME|nr:histone-lysine N-methyltransferase, H3 lysine-79 specific [Galleria mellonella]